MAVAFGVPTVGSASGSGPCLSAQHWSQGSSTSQQSQLKSLHSLVIPARIGHPSNTALQSSIRSIHGPVFESKDLNFRRAGSSFLSIEATAEVGEKESSLDRAAARTLRALENAVANGTAHPSLDLQWKVDKAESKTASEQNGTGTSSDTGKRQGIVDYLKGKHILVTGATGFLAKVLVEKILREQPDVGHIYLVIQPRLDLTAEQRLEGQVINSKVFDLVRGTHTDGYEEFMGSKLTAVGGNMGEDGLGMAPAVAEELADRVDIVINSAATTTFDERYDVAMATNTLGAKRVLDFAKRCKNLELLLHVSTAYTNGRRVGPTAERPFVMGDSIARELGNQNAPGVDVDTELALVERTLREAQAQAAAMSPEKAEAHVQKRMVELGMKRAQLFGWQDTYVFTKAMGEMLLSKHRGDLPVAIVRPSIVESSLSQPLVGWMEGIRMADPILLAYGKGQMDGFLADTNGWLDLVPVDFVINAMLAMLPKHAKTSNLTVYHVATSVCNPLSHVEVAHATSEHFATYPMMGRDKQPIQNPPMRVFPSSQMFVIHMWFKYQLPLQIEQLTARLNSSTHTSSMVRKRNTLRLKTFEQLSYLAKLYQPYTFYKCKFDASNTQQLFAELPPEEQERFNFDLGTIDWRNYLVEVHLPGLRKYVLKGRGSS